METGFINLTMNAYIKDAITEYDTVLFVIARALLDRSCLILSTRIFQEHFKCSSQNKVHQQDIS